MPYMISLERWGAGALSEGPGEMMARGIGLMLSSTASSTSLAFLALLASLYPYSLLEILLLHLRKLSSSLSLTLKAFFLLGVVDGY